MEKEVKLFSKLKSNQPFMGALIVVSMLLIATIFFAGIVPKTTKAVSTDFGYYKSIEIDSGYIGTTLTDFPILVHDNTGDLVGKVLANGSDIAFYALGNVTQYNHEIEMFNSTSGELIAWVNVTSVESATDTLFYMFYGDSDGGYTIGHNPTDTWDGYYAGVYHFNNSVNDSTSNDKDLTNHGAVAQSDGISGGCYNFTSTDLDYVDIAEITDVSIIHQITIEAWIRPTAIGGSNLNAGIMLGEFTTGTDDDCDLIWFNVRRDDGKMVNWFGTPQPYDGLANQTANQIFFNHEWTYASLVVDDTEGADGTLWTYSNGELVGFKDVSTGDHGGPIKFSNITCDEMNIGREHRSAINYYYDGSFDEIRISKTRRSGSWLNASFFSQNETIGFLTLGTEQEKSDESVYTLKGLPNDIITWSGAAGTAVWCNSSGDTNEWLEVNMTIIASDNITDILVWVGDLNDTTSFINASNITLWVSDASNVTYYSFGSFSDGGSNISINRTQWNIYASGLPNPFNGTGLKSKNTSIFLIFELVIPATVPTDIFHSISAIAWKIYLGTYS